MKNYIKSLNEYLSFINENYSPNNTKKDIINIFKKHGFDGENLDIGNYTISLTISENNKSVSNLEPGVENLYKDLVSYGQKNENILLLAMYLGYSGATANTLHVYFAGIPVKAKTVYYIVNNDELDEIMENGITPKKSDMDNSDIYNLGLTGGNVKLPLYKATFAHLTKAGAASYMKTNHMNKNYTIIGINSQNTSWYENNSIHSFMGHREAEAAKSIVTFDYIDSSDLFAL